MSGTSRGLELSPANWRIVRDALTVFADSEEYDGRHDRAGEALEVWRYVVSLGLDCD